MEVAPRGPQTYRQTFRKHRILFSLLPILLCVAGAVLALGSTKSYKSSATLWVDNPVSSNTGSGNVGWLSQAPSQIGASPATVEQSLLNELLATSSFDLGVARASSLPKALAASSHSGFSLSRLFSSKGSPQAAAQASVQDDVTSTIPGPQVLEISYSGPTAAAAQSIVNALVGHLQTAAVQLGDSYGQTVEKYYQTSQVPAGTRVLSQAEAAVAKYKRAHPSATERNNPTLAGLLADERAANSSLSAALSALDSAARGAHTTQPGLVVHVLDGASLAVVPTVGKKKLVIKPLAGLLVGLFLSGLLIVILTPGRAIDDGWEENEEASSKPSEGRGQQVAAAVLTERTSRLLLSGSATALQLRIAGRSDPEEEG